MSFIINFIIMFLIIYLFYYIFIIRKALKNKNKQPIEIKYLINLYKLDINKINYKSLLYCIALTTAFVIAFALTFTNDKITLIRQLILSVIMVLPLMFINYHIIGKIYQKRMMKND